MKYYNGRLSIMRLTIKTNSVLQGIMWGIYCDRHGQWYTRNTKTYLFNPSDVAEPRLFQTEIARYLWGSGNFETVKMRWKTSLAIKNNNMYLMGSGYTKMDFLFISEFNLKIYKQRNLHFKLYR
jgi:hypothetical protein